MKISAVLINSCKILLPSGFVGSNVIDFLPRFNCVNVEPPPPGAFRNAGSAVNSSVSPRPQLRLISGFDGFSILITSAPWSHNNAHGLGAAMTVANSMTRRPSNNFIFPTILTFDFSLEIKPFSFNWF